MHSVWEVNVMVEFIIEHKDLVDTINAVLTVIPFICVLLLLLIPTRRSYDYSKIADYIEKETKEDE